MSQPLSSAAARYLRSAGALHLPHAYEGDPAARVDVVPLLEGRLTAAPARLRDEFLLDLRILDFPFARLLMCGTGAAWDAMSAEERARRFARLGGSRIAIARPLFQAVRRLVLVSYYATPPARAGIGFPPPLHGREPAFEWEGPAVGDASRDEEPIARAPRGASRASWATPPPRAIFADDGLRTTDDLAIALLQGGAVGGGTTVNWMAMLRTPDHVLDEWERRFGITGFSPRTMAPLFERIEREVHATRVPDDAHSPANRVILDGARNLGWRVSSALINAKGCVRAGTCSLGCRYDAKQGGLLTFLPRAFARGARLYANARVERVEIIERVTRRTDAPRKRVHATVIDPATRVPRASLTIDAPVVILAA